MNPLGAALLIVGGVTGWLLASKAAVLLGNFLAGAYDLNDVWEDEDV